MGKWEQWLIDTVRKIFTDAVRPTVHVLCCGWHSCFQAFRPALIDSDAPLRTTLLKTSQTDRTSTGHIRFLR